MKNKKKKQKDKNIAKININLIGTMTSIISFLLIIILLLVKAYTPIPENQKFIVDIFITIFTAIMPVGIINLAYGYFDNLKHAEKYINEAIFNNKSYLNFNDEKLKEIKDSIINKLLYKDIEHEENTLLDVVQKEIEPLLQRDYVKDRIINVSCDYVDNKIVKDIYERIVYAKPKLKNNTTSIKLNIYDFLKIVQFDCDDNEKSCATCKECYQINKLIINGKDYTKKIDVHNYSNELYFTPVYKKQIKYQFKKEINLDFNDDEVVVELEYKTKVLKKDPIFVNKLRMPCKHYQMHFNFNDNLMDVIPCHFSFMDYDNPLGKRYIVNNNKSSIDIIFNDWVLPGEGVCLNIMLKNDLYT